MSSSHQAAADAEGGQARADQGEDRVASSAAAASTTNTVTATTRSSATRAWTPYDAVTVRKIGTARNGSSTAVSVTRNRRYS